MPVFKIIAKDKTGRIVEDSFFAHTQAAAIETVGMRGLEIISIGLKEEEVYASETQLLPDISLQDFLRFSSHFGALIKGNVPIIEALDLLKDETRNRTLKNIIIDVRSKVEAGMPLNEAFAKHKKHIPRILVDLIRVGEISGKLYESFLRITNYFEKTIDFRRKVRDAFTYPSILIFFIFLLITYVVTMLIPRFEEIYRSLQGELPVPTKILLAVGQFSRDNVFIILGSFVFTIIMYFEFYSTKIGKKIIDDLKLKLPLAGPLVIQYNVTYFVKNVSLLFYSGYSFINSLKESANTVDNFKLNEELNSICERIESGMSIHEAFKRSIYVPSFTVSMLKVGERSNTLAEMLDTIVEFNEKELDYITTTFLRIIEPVIIITLGIIVGTILFAAYLPIFSMSKLIKISN